MEIERIISWFSKDTQLLVAERNIDFISLDTLKTIFTPYPEDPLMYNPYDIAENEASELTKFVDMKFEFDKYWYQLDCFQKS